MSSIISLNVVYELYTCLVLCQDTKCLTSTHQMSYITTPNVFNHFNKCCKSPRYMLSLISTHQTSYITTLNVFISTHQMSLYHDTQCLYITKLNVFISRDTQCLYITTLNVFISRHSMSLYHDTQCLYITTPYVLNHDTSSLNQDLVSWYKAFGTICLKSRDTQCLYMSLYHDTICLKSRYQMSYITTPNLDSESSLRFREVES